MGKPPKNTQFQRGVSGNPEGRPKKVLDFDHELLRESRSFITFTESGRRKRITKHGVVVKQLVKQAMTGIPRAHLTYFGLIRQALDREALVGGAQPNNSGMYDDVLNLTDEELMRIISTDLKKLEQ